MNPIRDAALPLAALVLAGASFPLLADNATVGDGTPASCTEAALNAAVTQVVVGVQAPGGVLRFACGAAPHTIALTSQKFLSGGVVIDGGGLIALHGQNLTRHFHIASDEPEDRTEVLLRDITLILGNAGNDYGGAVVVGPDARLDLLRTTIVDSYAGLSGGAIATAVGSTLNISASRFRGNTAQAGGAIATNAITAIADSTFDNNFTFTAATDPIGEQGGAIVSYAAPLTLERSVFTNNKAYYGGAVYKKDAQFTAYDSRFSENEATIGGALYFELLAAAAVIGRSRFETNVAGIFGGAINSSEPLNVERSLFQANRSLHGGAIYLYSSRDSLLSRSTFSSNVSTFGGGGAILADGAPPTPGSVVRLTLLQVTTSGNSANYGGDLALETLEVNIVDSTLMNGVASNGASIDVGQNSVVRVDSSLIWAANGVACTVAGSAQLLTLDHNLAPASCGFGAAKDLVMSSFAAFGLGVFGDNGGGLPTFLPQPGSPAIDRRVGCFAAEDGDARRLPRPADGDGNGSLDCDAGAVERQPTETPGSLFRDGFESS